MRIVALLVLAGCFTGAKSPGLQGHSLDDLLSRLPADSEMIVAIDAARLHDDPDFRRLAQLMNQLPGVRLDSKCAGGGSFFLLGGNLSKHDMSARGWAIGTWSRGDFARCSQEAEYKKLVASMNTVVRLDGDVLVSTTDDLVQSATWLEDNTIFTSAGTTALTRDELVALATPHANAGPMSVPLTRALIDRVRDAPLWATGRDGWAIAIEPGDTIDIRVIAKGKAGQEAVDAFVMLFDLHPKRNGDEFRERIPRAKLRAFLSS